MNFVALAVNGAVAKAVNRVVKRLRDKLAVRRGHSPVMVPVNRGFWCMPMRSISTKTRLSAETKSLECRVDCMVKAIPKRFPPCPVWLWRTRMLNSMPRQLGCQKEFWLLVRKCLALITHLHFHQWVILPFHILVLADSKKQLFSRKERTTADCENWGLSTLILCQP